MARNWKSRDRKRRKRASRDMVVTGRSVFTVVATKVKRADKARKQKGKRRP